MERVQQGREHLAQFVTGDGPGHRERPVTSFTALVGHGTLFSSKTRHKVGECNHKTTQNEAAIGNGLDVGSIFPIA